MEVKDEQPDGEDAADAGDRKETVRGLGLVGIAEEEKKKKVEDVEEEKDRGVGLMGGRGLTEL